MVAMVQWANGGWRRGRRIGRVVQGAVLVSAVLGLAVAVLLAVRVGIDANASPQGRPAAAAVPAIPESVQAERDRASFDGECRRLVVEKLYGRAAKACERFLAHETLAGSAHALLAAIYTTPTQLDLPASVTHARHAAARGEARGKFMLAAHILAGRGTSADARHVHALLRDARNDGVPAARLYLAVLEEGARCRRDTTVRPLGLPVFCMFRHELIEALQAQGMRIRARSEEAWRDQFSPGDVLATALHVELLYDVDPREEIHRLARMTYVFEAERLPERWAQLRDGLSRKYGLPRSVQEHVAAVWPLEGGLQLSLQKVDADRLEIRYESSARWQRRGVHLAELAQVRQNDLLMAEWQAF